MYLPVLCRYRKQVHLDTPTLDVDVPFTIHSMRKVSGTTADGERVACELGDKVGEYGAVESEIIIMIVCNEGLRRSIKT